MAITSISFDDSLLNDAPVLVSVNSGYIIILDVIGTSLPTTIDFQISIPAYKAHSAISVANVSAIKEQSKTGGAYYSLDLESVAKYWILKPIINVNKSFNEFLIDDNQGADLNFNGLSIGFRIVYTSLFDKFLTFCSFSRQFTNYRPFINFYFQSLEEGIEATLKYVTFVDIPIIIDCPIQASSFPGTLIVDGTTLKNDSDCNYIGMIGRAYSTVGERFLDSNIDISSTPIKVDVLPQPCESPILLNYINRFGVPQNWLFNEYKSETISGGKMVSIDSRFNPSFKTKTRTLGIVGQYKTIKITTGLLAKKYWRFIEDIFNSPEVRIYNRPPYFSPLDPQFDDDDHYTSIEITSKNIDTSMYKKDFADFEIEFKIPYNTVKYI